MTEVVLGDTMIPCEGCDRGEHLLVTHTAQSAEAFAGVDCLGPGFVEATEHREQQRPVQDRPRVRRLGSELVEDYQRFVGGTRAHHERRLEKHQVGPKLSAERACRRARSIALAHSANDVAPVAPTPLPCANQTWTRSA